MSDANADKQNGEGTFFSREVVGGAPWAVSSKLVLFSVSFAVSILAAHLLKPDKYGVYALCQFMGEILTIVCSLGLGTALLRFIPELRIDKNRAGLVRLLFKSAVLQVIGIMAATIVLYAAETRLEQWFKVDLHYLIIFIVLFAAARLSKNFVDDVCTGLFQVRTLSILSIGQGLLWFALTLLLLFRFPEVHIAILAQIIPIFLVSITCSVILFRFIRRLEWRSPARGIGKRRVFRLSSASLLNALSNVLMRQYTEVYFLGLFFTPAVIGFYDWGCTKPLMLLTVIPLAVQRLFISGFADAYSKDKNCLGGLVTAMYRALIVVVLPIATFCYVFAPRAIELMLGRDYAEAGHIASLFFVIHTLSLISIPLATAVVTKERLFSAMPLIIVQVIVNLVLDVLLIPRYEMYGAAGAVFATFLLTLPLRFYIVKRIIGGIYFPTMFFLKVTVVLAILAGSLYPLAAHLNIVTLILLAAAYYGCHLVLLRVFRLVREEDIVELRNLGFGKLNKFLEFITAADGTGSRKA